MLKSKVARFALIGIMVLTGTLVFASCTPATPAGQVEVKSAPAAVIAIPNVVTPRFKTTFAGANFEPGEEVEVAVLTFPGTDQIIGKGRVEGEPLTADELGSFQTSGKAPLNPGVYAVKVYDAEGKVRAVTILEVKEKE